MEASSVLSITREEVDHRTFARTVDQVRRLEIEAERTFQNLHETEQRMKGEHKITVAVEMTPAMTAAYREWRIAHDKALEIRPETG